jgi:hypothetical protein
MFNPSSGDRTLKPSVIWILLVAAIAALQPGCGEDPVDGHEGDAADDDGEYDTKTGALAAAGAWSPPKQVRDAGAAQFIAYADAPAWEGGKNCGGSLHPGTRELGDFLKANFAGKVSSYGGYACRQNTANAAKTSVHGTGRALDVFIPLSNGQADNGKGDEVANWLVVNAQAIGVQYIIWDRMSWGGSRKGDKLSGYSGPHPHHDHIHLELTHEGAARETPWFGGPKAPPGETPPPPPPPPPTASFRAIAATPSGKGYWEVASDGAIFSYGDAQYHGGANSVPHEPIIALAPTPSGGGYALLASDGAVYAYGDAKYAGGANEYPHAPVVGIATAPADNGYWIASNDGAIYSFGGAPYLGGANETPHAPIVGIVSTPGTGYWLVASDGAIYSYGDAAYYGGSNTLDPHPSIIGMARTPTGAGYWQMANDGAIYSYGDAVYQGGANTFTHQPVVGITAGAGGYWEMADDGSVYSFGVEYYGGANVK